MIESSRIEISGKNLLNLSKISGISISVKSPIYFSHISCLLHLPLPFNADGQCQANGAADGDVVEFGGGVDGADDGDASFDFCNALYLHDN